MFRIEVRQDGADTVWALVGELDALTAPALDAHVEACVARLDGALVVDLTGLTYLNSRGIGALIQLDKRLREAGRPMRLRGASPRFDRIFRFCGLDTYFAHEARADASA